MNFKSAAIAAITTDMAITAKMFRHTRRSTASGAANPCDSSSFEGELSEAKLYRPPLPPIAKPQILAMQSGDCPASHIEGGPAKRGRHVATGESASPLGARCRGLVWSNPRSG